MLSRCTIRRKTGTFTVTDGFKVPDWEIVATDVPVRIAGASRGASQSRGQQVGATYEAASREGSLPISQSDLRDDDHLDMTSGETSDLVFRIVEADHADQRTARRVRVIAVERPGEWI